MITTGPGVAEAGLTRALVNVDPPQYFGRADSEELVRILLEEPPQPPHDQLLRSDAVAVCTTFEPSKQLVGDGHGGHGASLRVEQPRRVRRSVLKPSTRQTLLSASPP